MNGDNFGLKRFVFSRFVGALCDQFLLFAVPLAILKATGSLTFASLAFVIEWLPRIIFFPLSGFMADRIKPRFIFFNVDAVRAVLMIVTFVALYLYPQATFPALATMMALLSVAYVLNFVATDALLPRHISSDALPKAHTMLQGVDQITMVLGPAIAVIISAYGGINSILLVAAVLFAISAINYLFLETHDLDVTEKMGLGTLIESNRTALTVLKQNKILLHLCALTWVVNLVYGSALVVSAAVILQEFNLSDRYFGVLQTTAAVVTIITFFFVPRFARRFGLSSLGTLSFCAMILAGAVMSLSIDYTMYLIGYAVLMAFDGSFSVYLRTLRSQVIPKEHLGKTMGLIGLMNMCSVPASGAIVSLLSGSFMPLQIIAIILVAALIFGIALIVFGRRAFGYRSWLPPVITANASS
ncbi:MULTISPECIES: MFS transporter [Pectobacterium]|uniref:MFS transporter n=1 Tax=Pectobacterium punjabense TaxID=2108399 RepID=A0ABX6L6W5_9GAMM|nr:MULTISPECIES: MFS transporter [Pectobacterium]MBS4430272.1 MFS transporter [Pectobacterium punjabense]MCE9731153.1 SetB [Pectobacterium sp. IFB5596]PTA62207.1 MFS transporter [Pectobacterium punjabense]QJA22049.1 MFS transporter [Pectobacterium punjabense]